MTTGNQNSAGAVITLEEAIEFTHAYQEEYPDSSKAYLVNVDKLNLITEQEGCVKVRIYNGYDTQTNNTNLVLVGVDNQGEDLTDGIIIERTLPCPPYCPDKSPLIQ
ncbi:MAG: hypothetical protein KF704_12400 [Crocinitomicaceae bacterium]|nr:hypothetical protein [Crocinitomicaceae bacterium]